MRLLARINLILLSTFALATIGSAWLGDRFLKRGAEDRVYAEARLITETASATRLYAEQQIKPLMARLQKRGSEFLPQVVPTYSAIQVTKNLHNANPQYSYKDAMLNPTNPADRATDWETDIINEFRNEPALSQLYRVRDSSSGKYLFAASPIKITDVACLECHSSPSRAPAAMIRQYGPNNGFGWKLNATIGAQIVSVPETVPIQMAKAALRAWIVYLAITALVMVALIDSALVFTVIRPAARLSRMADEISQGKPGEDLPVRGRDEISLLARSFNRMRRSLAKAMRMLEGEGDS